MRCASTLSRRLVSRDSRRRSFSWVRRPLPEWARADERAGYYNPLLAYTESLAVKDAKKNGANGFIVVDLPPEEAVGFRNICTEEGYVSRGTWIPR